MKKLLIFLMVALPIAIILVVNFTISVVIGDAFIAVERIVLSETSITANVDDVMHIDYTIYPQNATNKEVIWSSDNEDVATVDVNGNVTFVGFGEGHIIATSQDGNKRASMSYYVTDSKVHQVVITSPKTQIAIGESVQLVANVLPNEAINKAVTFASNDETIAKVSLNGLVYGLSEGIATITVTTEDGGFTDSINISVIKPVTSIVLDEEDVITSKSFYQINHTIYPSDATIQNVKYSIDDSLVASVNEFGMVTFLKAGTVNVTVITDDGNFKDTISITFTDGYATDLILDEISLNLKVDDVYLINYQTIPQEIYNTDVEFYSQNEDIARVDTSGFIYAMGGGNTVIEVSIHKNKDEVITKQIYVYVEKDAEDIKIDNIIFTAEKEIRLNPSSLPNDSTNSKFFFHSYNENIAEVLEDGTVIFKVDYTTSVQIEIYANEDLSSVKKVITVIYTAGRANDYELKDNDIEVNYGDIINFNIEFYPQNTVIKDYEVFIVSTDNNGSNVIEILDDGRVKAVGGGSCVVEIKYQTYEGEILSKYCDITVIRPSEDIRVDINLEMYQGQYVTAEERVMLNATVLPFDSTDKSLVWTCEDSNIGVILDNSIFIFNSTGVVRLTVTNGNISKIVEIRYTASKPISAQVLANIDGVEQEIPQQIKVGQSFEIILKSVLPNNSTDKNIVIKITNQNTQNPGGKVLSVNGNTISGVAGGKATLLIYISTTITISKDIEVIQDVKSITTDLANTTTTENEITLSATVLPVDATDKTIRYEILSGSAYIEGDKLIFNSNGKVTIRAISNSNSEIYTDFVIEKIEKDAIVITKDDDIIKTYKGEVFYVDFSKFIDSEYTSTKIEIISSSDNDILLIEDKNIRVNAIGNSSIKISIFNNKNEIYSKIIEFNVVSRVESIKLKNDLDFYNGEYVTANSEITLDFEILPNDAEDKTLNYSIVESSNIAYLMGNKLYFLKEGFVTLEVTSQDGGVKEKFVIRYTDGKILQAQLNYEEELVLNEGEIITIEVVKTIPKDANISKLFMEITGESNIVKISGNQIIALKGGQTTLSIEISDDITKIINISVIKKVTDIVIEENILTSKTEFTINPKVLPTNATYPNLTYTLQKTEIATIDGNVIKFKSAGSVVVLIETQDGSNICKEITITSTMGSLSDIVLSSNNVTINKNDTYSITINNVYPSDISSYEIEYEIISQNAVDGSDNNVIKLENNLVKALYGGTCVVRVWGIVDGVKSCYSDCEINVITHVENISIEFDHELQLYQNSFVTGQQVLNFKINLNPTDATIKDYTYTISNLDVAYIENNQIIFKKTGIVVITFISSDKTNGEKSVSYNFNYTGSNLIEAIVDKSAFENNVLVLEKGEVFKFNFSYLLPQDNNNLTISTENVKEDRLDESQSVIELNGGVFYANAGGTYTFTLKVNNLTLGQYTFIVRSYAEEIVIDGDFIEEDGIKTAYISSSSYSIQAKSYPSDTFQTELLYKSSDTNIAEVNSLGIVTFKKYGLVTITITVKDKSSVSQQLNIEYTNELRGLSFGEISNTMYNVGDNVDFVIIPSPSTATDFEYDIILSDYEIATHIIKSDGTHRIIGNKEGNVVVTAKVKNSDIETSITLTFVTKISSIELELDSINDVMGLGGYRQFGDGFLQFNEQTNTFYIVNTYQMNFNIKPSNASANMLVWSSSNERIASVDENGVVTFHGYYGKVTITVKAKSTMEGQLVASDSYTFNIVKGINIFGPNDSTSTTQYNNQFDFAVEYLRSLHIDQNQYAIVLHDDILFNPNISNYVFYDICGNGYSICFYDVNSNERLVISKSNVNFDNVTLKGTYFDSNAKLSDLRNTGKIVVVRRGTNVNFYNCIFENAENLVDVISAQVTFKGCVFRNSYSAGLMISREWNYTKVSDVYVKDSIFANSLLCGILFNIDGSTQLEGYESNLTLDGEIRFYNWITLDELEQGLMSDLEEILSQFGLGGIAKDIAKQFKDIMKKYSDYKYTYNGKDYYNFCILQYDAKVVGQTFKSNGKIKKGENFNASIVYSDVKIEGSLVLGGGVTNADFVLNAWMMPGQNPAIKPGQSHEEAFNKIRQPERIYSLN